MLTPNCSLSHSHSQSLVRFQFCILHISRLKIQSVSYSQKEGNATFDDHFGSPPAADTCGFALRQNKRPNDRCSRTPNFRPPSADRWLSLPDCSWKQVANANQQTRLPPPHNPLHRLRFPTADFSS